MSKLTDTEKAYITEHWMVKTDRIIASELKRNIKTISAYRKKCGFNKTYGGQIDKLSLMENTSNTYEASLNLAEESRKNFFKIQLKNSLFYKHLKDALTEGEIRFYLEEWSALCIQFEDIVGTEKRQIDELIKSEIMGNRILRNIKIAEDEIEIIQTEIEELRKIRDVENDEHAQERDMQLLMLVRQLHAQSQAMSSDYQKNVDMRNKLLSELNGRRKDRVDQIKKSGTTFMGLIENLHTREKREVEGRYIELMKLATDKKKQDWRTPITFPDGTKDCILMDEGSELPTRDIVIIEHAASTFFEYFRHSEHENIAILDTDEDNIKFFKIHFENSHIHLHDSNQSIIDSLKKNKYDLICINYRLSEYENADKFVRYIITKDLCKDSKFLIYPNEAEQTNRLGIMLNDERDFETCNIEDLGEDKNA